MPRSRAHWLLGSETHFGRGYFALELHATKTDALRSARDVYLLRKSEMQELAHGRVEFPLRRARELKCDALELTSCDCKTPEVHDG